MISTKKHITEQNTKSRSPHIVFFFLVHLGTLEVNFIEYLKLRNNAIKIRYLFNKGKKKSKSD